ncbi:MAG: 3D domain-containing protein [Candidatus Humimicrobiaceae bacterium]
MKPKLKDILIIILIIALIAVSFTFFVRETLHALKIKKLNQTMLEKVRSQNITLAYFIADYSKLWRHFQVFTGDYQNLLTEQEVNNEIGIWERFEVTAYSSQECGDITSIGIDLQANYSKYLNIAAVDPKVISYGSILLIKFKDGSIKPYIAADCGGLIKGRSIDLYMTDVSQALQFGRQKLMVRVIK